MRRRNSDSVLDEPARDDEIIAQLDSPAHILPAHFRQRRYHAHVEHNPQRAEVVRRYSVYDRGPKSRRSRPLYRLRIHAVVAVDEARYDVHGLSRSQTPVQQRLVARGPPPNARSRAADYVGPEDARVEHHAHVYRVLVFPQAAARSR